MHLTITIPALQTITSTPSRVEALMTQILSSMGKVGSTAITHSRSREETIKDSIATYRISRNFKKQIQELKLHTTITNPENLSELSKLPEFIVTKFTVSGSQEVKYILPMRIRNILYKFFIEFCGTLKNVQYRITIENLNSILQNVVELLLITYLPKDYTNFVKAANELITCLEKNCYEETVIPESAFSEYVLSKPETFMLEGVPLHRSIEDMDAKIQTPDILADIEMNTDTDADKSVEMHADTQTTDCITEIASEAVISAPNILALSPSEMPAEPFLAATSVTPATDTPINDLQKPEPISFAEDVLEFNNTTKNTENLAEVGVDNGDCLAGRQAPQHLEIPCRPSPLRSRLSPVISHPTDRQAFPNHELPPTSPRPMTARTRLSPITSPISVRGRSPLVMGSTDLFSVPDVTRSHEILPPSSDAFTEMCPAIISQQKERNQGLALPLFRRRLDLNDIPLSSEQTRSPEAKPKEVYRRGSEITSTGGLPEVTSPRGAITSTGGLPEVISPRGAITSTGGLPLPEVARRR